jgi:anti-sigma regulatory factor (Ser/Thr protein kinase)
VTVPSAELVADLSIGNTTASVPHVIDDLFVAVEQETWQHDDIPSPATAWVGNLRRIAAGKLAAAGLSVLVDDVQLLVSELLTNAFQHGAGRQVGFRLVIGVDAVVIEVDDGSPYRPEVRAAGPEDENGRGMFLVDALADSWGVSPDGTRTWCALSTTPPVGVGRSAAGRGQEEGSP